MRLRIRRPTNAAIFLPASNTEYHIGGYINYDCSTQSPEMLLQHLADVVAPKVSSTDAPLHITDNDTLSKWIGDDYAYLADCHVLAVACKHEGETLAVIVLFRDQTQPFTPLIVETCAAVGPTLAEHLTRLIRIHHRGTLENDAEAA